jgi:hypothetical protein
METNYLNSERMRIMAKENQVCVFTLIRFARQCSIVSQDAMPQKAVC